MPNPKGKTLGEDLKELASREYPVVPLNNALQSLRNAATECNVKDVLTFSGSVGSAIEAFHQFSLGKLLEGGSLSGFADAHSLIFNLQAKVTEEVLATLKAKQCKCR